MLLPEGVEVMLQIRMMRVCVRTTVTAVDDNRVS